MATKEVVEFEVTLDDESVRDAARDGPAGLTKIEGAIKRTQTQYQALSKQMKDLQKGSAVDIELMRKLQAQHKVAGERIAALTTRSVEYRSALGRTSRETQAATGWTTRLKEGLGNLASRGVEATSTRMSGLVAKITLANVASAAIIGVWNRLTSAAASAAASIWRVAVSSQDARRAELIHLEAMSKVYSVWGIVREKGKVVQTVIDDIAQTSATGRDKLAGYAAQLQNMGFRGKSLADSLDAMGIIAATQGDEYANRFAVMAQSTVFFGGSVSRMANDVRARLGGLAKQASLGLGVQLAKLKENMTSLFRSVDITPFLSALHKVLALFSLSSSTGRALKVIFSGLFTVLFGQAGKAANTIHDWIQRTILSVQVLILRVLRMGDNGASALTSMVTSWVAGAAKGAWDTVKPYMVSGFTSMCNTLAPVIGAAALPIGREIVFGLLKGITQFLGDAFINLHVLFVAQFLLVPALLLRGIGAAFDAIGLNLMAGIARGIADGLDMVLQAIVNVGEAMKSKFKTLLGIHSPSTVFRAEGRWIPAGVAVGIRAGAPQVRAATRDMMTLPTRSAAMLPPVGMGGFSRPAGNSVHVERIIVQASGGDGRTIAQDIKAELERLLEGVVIEMGGAT